MKSYNKEYLENIIKESHNWSEVFVKLNKNYSSNSLKCLKRNIENYQISILHFDKYFKNKSKRTHKIIEKKCPICSNQFVTEEGSKDEKTYCSSKCANSLKLGNRNSKESNLKTSLSLRGRPSLNRGKLFKNNIESTEIKIVKDKNSFILYEKKCLFCYNIFKTKRPKQNFCNGSCQMKGMWQREGYRNKILNSIHERVNSGKHQGWTTRNILSYPEKFFKKVLELNGFKDLGLEDNACFFLDFYFKDLNIDLEIDGKQHEYPERKDSDNRRDKALKNNGYIVYRIKWKNIQKNKEYIKEEIQKLLKFLNEGLIQRESAFL
jgi:very-short-patch-repair endonuclease/endogenous inhibitor of DNA gyrase (YacG/DUF329 family)